MLLICSRNTNRAIIRMAFLSSNTPYPKLIRPPETTGGPPHRFHSRADRWHRGLDPRVRHNCLRRDRVAGTYRPDGHREHGRPTSERDRDAAWRLEAGRRKRKQGKDSDKG